jgi:hypothetical protein
MKKALLGAASVAALALGAVPASATNVTVTGYSLPDPNAFGAGQIDGYSYYDGPVTLHTSTGDITAYCADLNHVLHAQDYHTGPLAFNGLGDPIDLLTSQRVEFVAKRGFKALSTAEASADPFTRTQNFEFAAAAQLAIWSLLYPGDPVTNFANIDIQDYFVDLELFPAFAAGDKGATVLIPNGNWPSDYGLSQQMVVTFSSSVPEASTWTMGLMGFGLTALFGLYKTRNRVTA